jgi:hypothetical protein
MENGDKALNPLKNEIYSNLWQFGSLEIVFKETHATTISPSPSLSNMARMTTFLFSFILFLLALWQVET